MPAPVLVWFREDFRLADNAALSAASDGGPLLCVFILDPATRPLSAAGWWLHGALDDLDRALRRQGGALHILWGDATQLIPALAQASEAHAVHWNRRYDPSGREIDTRIKTRLKTLGIAAHSFAGALLHEPWSLRTRSGTPFQVFTPFWKTLSRLGSPRAPLPAPEKPHFSLFPETPDLCPVSLAELALRPVHPDWATGFSDQWTPGEHHAHETLRDFLEKRLHGYAHRRDYPGAITTSRLSPALRAGHLTPAQLWHAVSEADAPAADKEKFLSELGWREFSWSILFEQPDLAGRNLRPEFDALPWETHPAHLRAWRQGLTGYPLVDAGMRELWRTGWMHNRVRMVTASFLIKHLLVDWRVGERWFADTLIDHDPAINPMNWQWSAGTGVDAAPFFRIMNPILQSEKFDPDGAYIRLWLPEIARLPTKFLHAPWTAPSDLLGRYGIELGKTYPAPVIDHATARQRALGVWNDLRTR